MQQTLIRHMHCRRFMADARKIQSSLGRFLLLTIVVLFLLCSMLIRLQARKILGNGSSSFLLVARARSRIPHLRGGNCQ